MNTVSQRNVCYVTVLRFGTFRFKLNVGNMNLPKAGTGLLFFTAVCRLILKPSDFLTIEIRIWVHLPGNKAAGS